MKELIKKIRSLVNMSQEQFAKEIGTTVISINRFKETCFYALTKQVDFILYLCIIILEVISMLIDTNVIVPMTDANQNFSKVTRIVDMDGMAVIMKNNKPRYIVVDFDEYEMVSTVIQMRKQKIDTVANSIIDENMEALLELAK